MTWMIWRYPHFLGNHDSSKCRSSQNTKPNHWLKIQATSNSRPTAKTTGPGRIRFFGTHHRISHSAADRWKEPWGRCTQIQEDLPRNGCLLHANEALQSQPVAVRHGKHDSGHCKDIYESINLNQHRSSCGSGSQV